MSQNLPSSKADPHRSQSCARSPVRSLQPFLVVDLKSLQSKLKHRFKVEDDEDDGTEEEEEEAMVLLLLDL